MSLADELQNMSDEELGRLAAPSSEKLGFFSKLGNALAGRRGLGGDLFGTDSESIGRQIRSQLIAREAAADFDEKRLKRQKDQNILDTFDIDNSGTISFKELPKSEQNRRRAEGQIPSIPMSINDEVLGPVKPLFSEILKSQENGKVIPDEFGGKYESKEDVGLTDFGQEAMQASGSDLLTALVGGGKTGLATDSQASRGVEEIVRPLDPGLQATKDIENLDAEVPMAVARQAFESVQTDLRTPRSSAEAETIDKQTLGTSLAAIMMQTGANESEVLATMDVLPDNVPVSFANQLLSQVASARGETAKIAARSAQLKETQDRLDSRQQERYKLITNLKDHTAEISHLNASNLKFLGYQFASQLQAGQFGNQKKLAFEKDQRRFAHDLEMFSKQEALTKEETQFKFGAQAVLQTMRGEAALNMETIKQGHRLALKQAGADSNNKDVLKEFVTDFMKSSPQVAEQFVDLIASAPPGQDPFEIQTIREAMSEVYKDIVDADTAYEVVRVAQGTDIAADTLKEKTAWLQSEMNRLGAGQPSLGIPPMSPDQLKIIQDQIDFNKGLMEAGGQNITIMGDEKPLLPEQAGKIADVYLNKAEVSNVRQDLFNEDGSVDKVTLQTMQEISLIPSFFPGGGVSFSGLPFTKGREVSQRLYRVIDTIVRAKTGAAMPEHEWPFYRALFFPSMIDSQEGIQNKFDRLQQWHDVFLSLVDPRGVRRTMLGSGKPQQSLKSPSQQKPRKQVIRELLDSGVAREDIPKALQGMGY